MPNLHGAGGAAEDGDGAVRTWKVMVYRDKTDPEDRFQWAVVPEGFEAGVDVLITEDRAIALLTRDALNEKEQREAVEGTLVVNKGTDGLFWFRNGQYERVPDEANALMQERQRIRDGVDTAPLDT